MSVYSSLHYTINDVIDDVENNPWAFFTSGWGMIDYAVHWE